MVPSQVPTDGENPEFLGLIVGVFILDVASSYDRAATGTARKAATRHGEMGVCLCMLLGIQCVLAVCTVHEWDDSFQTLRSKPSHADPMAELLTAVPATKHME